jgi:hypothetical protein
MRRVVVLTVLALALPIVAWANGIEIVNRGGTVFIDPTTFALTSSQSRLVQFNQQVAPKGHAFGLVSFATGVLNSGTFWTGGTFSDVGSYFNVTNTGGLKGVPKGPIFTGAFVGPLTWTLVSETGKGCPTAPCLYSFQLSGTLSGQLYTGNTVTGNTVQNISAFFGQTFRDHQGDIHLGNSHFATPEPGTLGLLGIGLVSVAGMVRRKLGA